MMDGAGEGGLAARLIDGVAALLFAAAAAFAAAVFLGPPAAAIGGAAGFGAAFLFLRSVTPEPRRHRLPPFDLIGWDEIELEDEILELAEPEPLLLTDRLTVPEDSRVVRLFAVPPLPSPGELKARIDAHLAGREAGAEVVHLPVDASAALREALADLRRSIG